MSKKIYNRNGDEIDLVETNDIKNLRFIEYNLYESYGISNPVDGIKKIYTQLPVSEGYPIFINLRCGAMYSAILQKASNNYLSAIIFGYSTNKIIFLRKHLDNWYES